MLKVRVFRAVEDLESCQRFAEGHANVLRDYGVSKVTSARNDWFYNPDVYVAVVEKEVNGDIVGGERIHMDNPEFQLPIETAVGIVDDRISGLVAGYARQGRTGELCGLWHAKEIAGMGIGFFFIKLGVAFAVSLHMNSLLALSSPFTVSMCQQVGFEVETAIGNLGTFFYPKLDLIATALSIRKLDDISNAEPPYFAQIHGMINSPVGTVTEQGAQGRVDINYNIVLPFS